MKDVAHDSLMLWYLKGNLLARCCLKALVLYHAILLLRTKPVMLGRDQAGFYSENTP